MERTFEQRSMVKLLLACSMALGTLTACGGDDDPAPTATTTSGVVVGTESATARAFLGIPYAAPPVGALRWKAPAAPASWTGTRSATQFAPHCAQPASPYGVASSSEDCLYLNVYTPKTAGPHPVMVWIHGGAFYLGQSDTYKPDALVAENHVVVTVNYRLGALGFMAHPALTAEHGTASGNYGLMDQQAALTWVKNNIANFGGNKDNVTIFGESAGGFSVNSHLASPGSAGLFHKAIAMSGAYPFGSGQDTLAQSETKGTTFSTNAGCTAQTLTCLRGLSVDSLLSAQAGVWAQGPIPSVDTAVLTKTVRASFTAGEQAKVPVIQGTTHDEWRLFVAQTELATGTAVTSTNFTAALTASLGPIVASAAPAYPLVAYPNASVALGAIGTDAVFSCSGRVSGKLLAAVPNSVVYSYEFNDPTAPQTLPGTVSFTTGSAHTSELQYLFTLNNGNTLTTAQRTLANTIVGYFTRFSRTGDPNGGAAVTWPAYTTTNDVYLSLASPTVATTTAFAADHKCNIWTPGV